MNSVPHSAKSEKQESQENQQFQVIIDVEDRYTILPANRNPPPYWRAEGFKGLKQECLDYIGRVWTDMRPRSLRLQMEEWERETAKTGEPWKASPEELRQLLKEHAEAVKEGTDRFHQPQPPNSLVKRLMILQPIEVIRYRNEKQEPDIQRLTTAINRGYILVKFPWTQGGTEIGLSLDPFSKGKAEPDWVDWTVSNQVSLRGRLKLDYTPIMVHVTIHLSTFKGEGYVRVCPWWKSPQEFRNEELKMKQEQSKN